MHTHGPPCSIPRAMCTPSPAPSSVVLSHFLFSRIVRNPNHLLFCVSLGILFGRCSDVGFSKVWIFTRLFASCILYSLEVDEIDVRRFLSPSVFFFAVSSLPPICLSVSPTKRKPWYLIRARVAFIRAPYNNSIQYIFAFPSVV